ncbi:lithostathine-like [Cyprinus carpio]|uniref:Lithostathine-like n=1 Tax=Cyprinus carpio TaxID=7962 RepID=A0A9Q9XXS3_CYPCA|nr:lithostathine-like [Cyprinus carpio]
MNWKNNFLIGLLRSTTTRCWLGVQDAVEEGQWLWSDGTPYDYSNWCSKEPNNLNVGNFVERSTGPLTVAGMMQAAQPQWAMFVLKTVSYAVVSSLVVDCALHLKF